MLIDMVDWVTAARSAPFVKLPVCAFRETAGLDDRDEMLDLIDFHNQTL